MPDVIISDNQISKFSTRNAPIDEIHRKHLFTKKADTHWEVEKSRDVKGLLNQSWGDGTMAATSDWRLQTSESLKTASKGNMTEGSTFITRRFQITGGRVTPPLEKCFGTSSHCPLHCCFLCFFLWYCHLRIEVTAILWQSVQHWKYTVSKHFLLFFLRKAILANKDFS